MLEYFESFGQGVFGDEILSQIIEDFPGELTDELLLVLSPPHLRYLKLTRCSRLSCSGLQKTIAKCVQLQALDFSECLHLLHPTVFCCLKDKAVNLVSLSLENSQVVSDDIVQVVLMCCPGLKHLNLSSCSNITDAAFALFNSESNTSSTACTNSPSSKTSSHPGCNLTSVDISGCQSLSTTTVKYLVGLCGAKLTSINLAWTGVNCTALLYLAGLNLDEVARLVHETDHAAANSAEEPTKHLCSYDNCCHDYQFTPECDGNDSSSDRGTMYMPRSKDGKYQTELQNQQATACSEENDYGLQNEFIWSQSFQHSTQHNDVVSQTYLSSTSPAEGMLAGHSNDCDESLLNEIELSGLKDVLPVTCKSSLLLSWETEHLQTNNEISDEESDDSFKTASEELDLMTCFLSGEETSFPFNEERNLSCEEPLTTQERCSSHELGYGSILKSAGARNLCWNVPGGNDSTSNMLDISESSFKDICVSGDSVMLSCDEGETRRESCEMFGHEYHVTRNPAVTSEQSPKELTTDEVYQDCFDMESHPVMTCKEEMIKKCGRSTVNTQDGHIAIMSHMTVNPTIPCEKVKEEEVKCGQSDYPIMPCARVDHAGSECCIKLPCDIDIVKESDYPNVPAPFSEMDHKECDCAVTLCENDEDVKSKNPKILLQCKVESIEPVCSQTGTLDVKDTNNRCTCGFPNMPCVVHESQEPSTFSVLPHSGGNIKPCWGDTGVIPDVPCKKQTDRQSNELFVKCSKTVKSRNLDCSPSHHGVLQVADLLQAQMYQPQITSLDISNIGYQSKALGEACLKVFSKACNRLKNFAVSWTGLDDEMLTYLLKNERELESLSLVDCETLSNLSVCTIPVYCPKLTSFDLKGMCYVMDHGIMPLTRSNDLEILRLAEAAITDSTLESIAKGCGAKLNVLDISWCEDITDHGMSMIANCCPALQHLGLRQCVASDLTLNALAANCHLISSLNIAGVDSLTDTTLGNLAENMPLLREIDASWNSSLSDIGVSALLECCTKLNKAVLCGLKRISSQPFLAIIGDLGRWYLLEQLWKTNARSLSVVLEGKLALKPCNSETAKSLGDQIPCRSMSYAPSLRQVLLEYSDKVNDDHLAAIVAVCRGTLFVKDYYGQPVEPKWIFKSG